MMNTDMKKQTVAEYLFGPCSKSVLGEKADESDYWENANEFITRNMDTPIAMLTFKERNWLIQIKEGLLNG